MKPQTGVILHWIDIYWKAGDYSKGEMEVGGCAKPKIFLFLHTDKETHKASE